MTLSRFRLIFSERIPNIKYVHQVLRENGFVGNCIYGETEAKKRDEIIQKFKTDSSQQYLILSKQVGGVGLTLTEATVTVILEPSYSQSTDYQAIGRIYRKGQTKKCSIYRLVVSETIDERTIARQAEKFARAKSLFSSKVVTCKQNAPTFNINYGKATYGQYNRISGGKVAWRDLFVFRDHLDQPSLPSPGYGHSYLGLLQDAFTSRLKDVFERLKNSDGKLLMDKNMNPITNVKEFCYALILELGSVDLDGPFYKEFCEIEIKNKKI